MADLANLVEELSKLTVIEAADLVKQLKPSGAFPPPRPLRLRLPALLLVVPLRLPQLPRILLT